MLRNIHIHEHHSTSIPSQTPAHISGFPQHPEIKKIYFMTSDFTETMQLYF